MGLLASLITVIAVLYFVGKGWAFLRRKEEKAMEDKVELMVRRILDGRKR